MNTPANHYTSYYLDLLAPLSIKEKFEIISQLLETIKTGSKPKSAKKSVLRNLKDFEGTWGDVTPVNKYVENLVVISHQKNTHGKKSNIDKFIRLGMIL